MRATEDTKLDAGLIRERMDELNIHNREVRAAIFDQHLWRCQSVLEAGQVFLDPTLTEIEIVGPKIQLRYFCRKWVGLPATPFTTDVICNPEWSA